MTEPLQPLPSSSPVAVSNYEQRRQRWAQGWCVTSFLFAVTGFCACVWQPDMLAALSLIPAWCWLLAGLAALFLSCRLRPRRWLVAMTLLWFVYVAVCVEEYRSLSRSVRSRFISPQALEPGELRLRVVSLNCADGSRRTAREAGAMTPDILLFQESPGRDDLEQLATELFGETHGVLWSADTSIVARWPIRRAVAQEYFVTGLIQLPNDLQLRVVSLRLAPPVVRYDLWNPACWREQTAKRRPHAKQVNQLRELLIDKIDDAILLGGDFNAAQHDRATWPLRDFARDTFDVAGHGWGNTVLNTIPMLRFDQIWTGGLCRATATWAVRSQHSDHRLVVSDLVLTDKSR